MFKIFHNEEEIRAWEKAHNDTWREGKYVTEYIVRLPSFCDESMYPLVIDEYSSHVENNSNGRDMEYFHAFSLPDLCKDEEVRKILLKHLQG